MPVSSGPKLNLSRAVAFAGLSLALGVGLIVLVVYLAGSGDVEVQLGDDVFEVGNAIDFAAKIAEDRAPRAYASLSDNRPIFLQHVGEDPLTGWFAIDARSPSRPEDCFLTWEVAAQVFVDPCGDAEPTYPPDGAGLLRYPVIVTDGRVSVDLRGEATQPPG